MILFACSRSEGLSMLMAKTSNPFALFFFRYASMIGISSLQGSHQLAQKLTKTTLPLLALKLNGFPLTRWPSILGAACPTSSAAIAIEE